MRQCFFHEGAQIQTPLGQFILAQNKLDSHHYALERVEGCTNNYVYDSYASFEDSHFLRYYTCWDEEEAIIKKVEKEDTTEVKGVKKKSGGLANFLSKKKAEVSEPNSAKTENASKSKKEIETKKQEIVKVKVVYIQLDAFQPITMPEHPSQAKDMMAIIYLLAQAVHKSQSVWPNMIPVMSNDGCFRFVKKGSTREQELVRLFEYLTKQIILEKWSKQISSAYEEFKLYGEVQSLTSRIHADIEQVYSKQQEIKVKLEGKLKSERAKILEPGTILLVEEKRTIHMSQYNIVISYNGEDTKEITLEHYLEDEIIIVGEHSNFIIRYLKTFRSK